MTAPGTASLRRLVEWPARWAGVAALATACGCVPKPAPSAHSAAPVPNLVSDASAPREATLPRDAGAPARVSPAPAASPSMNTEPFTIRSEGVGDVLLGRPLPESLRGDDEHELVAHGKQVDHLMDHVVRGLAIDRDRADPAEGDAYVRCGLLAHGFLRVACPRCRQEIVVGCVE